MQRTVSIPIAQMKSRFLRRLFGYFSSLIETELT